MKRTRRFVVSADGDGVVSHAGTGLLRELAQETGLVDAWTAALIGTYKAMPLHVPGQVLADLAVSIADGADAIAGLAALRDQPVLFGDVASDPTAWRVLDRVSPAHLGLIRSGRAAARERAWAAGAAPDLSAGLIIDIDATIVIAHSEKQDAAPTWKHTFGHHPLFAFLDRPEIAAGEALAGVLRPGNAGSNTAADHVELLELALAALPEAARPDPDDPDATQVLVRTDAAGATHAFAAACRESGVSFSVGFAVDNGVQEAVLSLDDDAWWPAIETDGEIRDGAWVAEITDIVELGPWPEGSRLIVRKERPHPGAQLRFTDVDGCRVTAFLTDTPWWPVSDELAGLELRHRQHARVEDRIRGAKAAGLRNLPCRATPENAAWLECLLAGIDLVCWSKLICFADAPELTRCEIAAFRYRVLHVAGRIIRTGRQTQLRLDRHWRWAAQLADGFGRLRDAFA